MPEAHYTFPEDFLWGTATSAHQVEGHNRLNEWWAWEQKGEGRVFGDQVSGAACDWWEGRAEEDIARMKELGTNAHRFSIEWSRVEPVAEGWDFDALDRYRKILKAMKKAGIQPMITLHHFTNPLWFAEQGGWLNPESPEWFARFAEKAVTELVDLCDTWCTINEPNVYAAQSYFLGKWPPGETSIRSYFKVLLHLLKGHARAYQAIHRLQPEAKVGLAKHMVYWQPRSSAPPDRLIANLLDRAFNSLTLNALQSGEWKPPIGAKGSFPELAETLDWIGLNYYQRYDAFFNLAKLNALGVDYRARPGREKGPEGWGEIYPEALFKLIVRLYRQFEKPIYITENGMPDENDTRRPAFLIEHLTEVWRAVMWNIPVKGYYFWSLLDNFEWSEGYDPRFRFGLYRVDFETQERTATQSAELYKEIAGSGTLSVDMAHRYAPKEVDRLFPGVESPTIKKLPAESL